MKINSRIKLLNEKSQIALDRDGVLNKDKGYVDFEKILNGPKVQRHQLNFKQLNFKVIIVSNQSGIARGFLNIVM